MTTYACPTCGIHLDCSNLQPGSVVSCPNCRQAFLIPGSTVIPPHLNSLASQSSSIPGHAVTPPPLDPANSLPFIPSKIKPRQKKQGSDYSVALVIGLIAFALLLICMFAAISPKPGANQTNDQVAVLGGLFVGVLGLAFFLLIIIVVGFIYFLPIIVAVNRNHRNTTAIAALTVIFGWTFLGWGIALVWAFSNDVHEH